MTALSSNTLTPQEQNTNKYGINSEHFSCLSGIKVNSSFVLDFPDHDHQQADIFSTGLKTQSFVIKNSVFKQKSES